MCKHYDDTTPDYIRILQANGLNLKATPRKEIAKGYVYNFTEWHDMEGKLYFYTVRSEVRDFKTHPDDREFQRNYMKNWRDQHDI